MRVLMVLCVVVLVAMACGGSGTDTSGLRVLTEVDNGQQVMLAAGEPFEVRLESNPSTGFEWDLVAPVGPFAFELRTHGYEEPETDLVGAPGTEVFRFEAVGDAEVLRLEYVRPFDDPPIPERVVEYIVRVDDAAWPPEGVEPPSTSTAPAPIDVAEVLAGGARDVSVVGYVVLDDNGARLCEALAESFPPQCGGASIPIANPEALMVALEKEQTVQWTNERVGLDGTFDGTALTLTP